MSPSPKLAEQAKHLLLQVAKALRAKGHIVSVEAVPDGVGDERPRLICDGIELPFRAESFGRLDVSCGHVWSAERGAKQLAPPKHFRSSAKRVGSFGYDVPVIATHLHEIWQLIRDDAVRTEVRKRLELEWAAAAEGLCARFPDQAGWITSDADGVHLALPPLGLRQVEAMLQALQRRHVERVIISPINGDTAAVRLPGGLSRHYLTEEAVPAAVCLALDSTADRVANGVVEAGDGFTVEVRITLLPDETVVTAEAPILFGSVDPPREPPPQEPK